MIEILQQAGSPGSERQMVVDAMQRCRERPDAAGMPFGDCESAIAQAFLADPTAQLHTSCIDALTAPSFL